MDRDVRHFIARLLEANDPPELSDDELGKLRAYLEATRKSAAAPTTPMVNYLWQELEAILHHNENLRIEQRPLSDAEILLDFVKGVEDLTDAIDTLNDESVGSKDRSLREARKLVIKSASRLRKRVGDLRDALIRQDMLTGERKDVLAKLSQSLDCMPKALLCRSPRRCGYRITEDCAPPEVVNEWNEHWRIVRRAAIDMIHWASAMTNNTPALATVSPTANDGDADDPEQAPALTEPQRVTMVTLNLFDPSVLVSSERISDEINPNQRLSVETVRQSVKRLIDLGLAERPEDERRGARLTIKGRRLAGKIAD